MESWRVGGKIEVGRERRRNGKRVRKGEGQRIRIEMEQGM
jgi:hypothetical protein